MPNSENILKLRDFTWNKIQQEILPEIFWNFIYFLEHVSYKRKKNQAYFTTEYDKTEGKPIPIP